MVVSSIYTVAAYQKWVAAGYQVVHFVNRRKKFFLFPPLKEDTVLRIERVMAFFP